MSIDIIYIMYIYIYMRPHIYTFIYIIYIHVDLGNISLDMAQRTGIAQLIFAVDHITIDSGICPSF